MHVDSVTVQYSLTQSLPDYCNVRPGLVLQATVESGEYPEDVFSELMAVARDECQRLVDQALEEAGKAPRYYAGPRFWLWRADHYVLVLPVHEPGPDKTPARRGHSFHYREILDDRGYTWETAVRLAGEQADNPEADVVLCRDGVVPPEVLADLETVVCPECKRTIPFAETRRGVCAECGETAVLPDRIDW